MVKVLLNNREILETASADCAAIAVEIQLRTGLCPSDYFLEQGGRIVSKTDSLIDPEWPVHCSLRLKGGKGGFGSMLRAIGAQIEKTTNREACRDLSGRRLRDINEEKRLLEWIQKQAEREKEAEDRKKKKIEKLLAKPKHEFKDELYEQARSKLAEKVNDAVEEGFKQQLKHESQPSTSSGLGAKRKLAPLNNKTNAKKSKCALWIDDDLSDTDGDTSSDDDDTVLKKTL